MVMKTLPATTLLWWGPNRAGPPRDGGDPSSLISLAPSILLLTRLLTGALASQCGLHALFFARLQVKGVTLDFLNNVFLLHFALETAQSVFEGLTLLQSYFGQKRYTPKLVRVGPVSYYKVPKTSQGGSENYFAVEALLWDDRGRDRRFVLKELVKGNNFRMPPKANNERTIPTPAFGLRTFCAAGSG
jgi:hypothetical protein